MKLVVGSDHAAFDGKEMVKNYLKDRFEIVDVGPESDDRCNYPDYAVKLSRKVNELNTLGILLCGSGIGVSIVANRFKGIRAALCRTPEEAALSRQHNDANVLCLGARINSEEELKKIIDTWFESSFENGRHSDRLAIFENMGIE
jgi:ribose 5-phosphate isomerase B